MTPGAWAHALLTAADATLAAALAPQQAPEHCALIVAAGELRLVLALPSGWQHIAVLPTDYARASATLVAEAVMWRG